MKLFNSPLSLQGRGWAGTMALRWQPCPMSHPETSPPSCIPGAIQPYPSCGDWLTHSVLAVLPSLEALRAWGQLDLWKT